MDCMNWVDDYLFQREGVNQNIVGVGVGAKVITVPLHIGACLHEKECIIYAPWNFGDFFGLLLERKKQ